MQYWLIKTEPTSYSWDDLKNVPDQRECWDGIRNYQARNYLRKMQCGDLLFFYHSQIKIPVVMGIVTVVRSSYPDPTQFDPSEKYYDPKSTPENPRWDVVDVQFYREFKRPVTLKELRATPGLEHMALLKKGSRLSVQPVSPEEWKIVENLGNS